VELRHLRYFVAVAELLHFGRAAERLGISQPSLSQQIRQLEDELQTTLLERSKRRVRLSDSGRLLLEEARDILARADHAAVNARRASRGEIGRLRIGLAYWMDTSAVLATIRRLDKQRPGIAVQLRVMSVPQQVAALRDERLDVGFVRPPIGGPALRCELLYGEPLFAALPRKHRLAGKERVALADLADEPHIMFPRDAVPQFYDFTLEACRNAGFVPHVRHEVDLPHLALGLVAAGCGISLVPASARRLRRPGVVFRPLRPSPRGLETAVAWRSDNSSAIVEEYLGIVRATMGARRE
jgi:DNA-binding transcriptional LysR family regulator